MLGSRRLVLWIYVTCITLILTFVAAFLVVGRSLREPPDQRRPPRHLQYVAHRLALAQKDPEALRAELKDLKDGSFDDRITVFNSDRRVLVSNVSPPLPPPGPNDRLGAPRCDRSGCTTYFRLGEGPAAGWAVLGSPFPPPSPLPPALTAAGLILLIASLGAAVLARAIARPLTQLSAAARALGEGQLGVRLHSTRRDEFGDVARAFDEMAARLKALLDSQTELLANVSHELRTPLARIRMALDLAAEGDAELARQSLADITEDLVELERLVTDVLTMARLDLSRSEQHPGVPPLRLEPVDASQLVGRSAERFRTSHPGRDLSVSADGRLPALNADPALLHRALDNVLDNASKYSEPSSALTLAAAARPGGVELTVTDRGVGMDAEELAKVFTPFFRSDRSRARATGGVGLGLALTRRIIEAHGGHVSVKSQPGQGTTVSMTVPTLV